MTKDDKGNWFRSTGKSLIPADKEAEEMLSLIGSRNVVRVRLLKPRRYKFHRFFFATVSNYYDNWPLDHPFAPDNAEHLRAWATCKTKHRMIIGEPVGGETDPVKIADFMERCLRCQKESSYVFIAIHNGSIVCISPKSIAFDVLDQKEFAPIADEILGVLEQESGISVATMMAEAV